MIEISEYNDIKLFDNTWDKVLEKSKNKNVFLTIDWLKSWLNVYSKVGDEQVILCIKENNAIIGLAPLIIKVINEYGLRYKKLQFIGSNQCDYMDFVFTQEGPESLNSIVNYVLDNSDRWNICEMNNFSEESNSVSILQKLLRERSIAYDFKLLSVCPYVILDAEITQYLKSKKSGLRYDLKRGERDLSKLGILKFVKIENQLDGINELPAFMEMLIRRDNQVERSGTKQSYEDQRNVYRNYLNLMWNNISFSKLTLDNKVIAYHLGFEYKKKLLWYKPTFDIDYIKFSVGKILIRKAMENALKDGVIELDFLLGDEPYKYQWAKESRNNYGFMFSSSNIKSKLPASTRQRELHQ